MPTKCLGGRDRLRTALDAVRHKGARSESCQADEAWASAPLVGNFERSGHPGTYLALEEVDDGQLGLDECQLVQCVCRGKTTPYCIFRQPDVSHLMVRLHSKERGTNSEGRPRASVPPLRPRQAGRLESRTGAREQSCASVSSWRG